MIFAISPAMEEQLLQLEYLDIALTIGATWWVPLIESIHVLAATLVVGMLLMIDLRLLGLAARRYEPQLILRQQLPWVWGAFITAVITGGLMFITNALAYASNTAMQYKLLLIVLAGMNTLILHGALRHSRNKNRDNTTSSKLPFEKISGALSLTVWVGVIIAGRWIGHLS